MVNIVNNTIALMHFDNEKNPFKDELGNLTWTINSGSTYITTDCAKFNKCINLVDVQIQSNEFEVGKDLTVDFWIYIYANLYYRRLFSINEVSTHYSYQAIRLMNSGEIFSSRFNHDYYDIIHNFASNTLLHVAFVSDSSTGTCRWYINGKLSNTDPYCMQGGNVFLGFGTSYNNDQGGVRQYIDELRVSNCVRYTNDFTPPNKPYDLRFYIYDENGNIYSS